MAKYECGKCDLRIQGKKAAMVNPLVAQHIEMSHNGGNMQSTSATTMS
jgi:predicted small metal-binding protein